MAMNKPVRVIRTVFVAIDFNSTIVAQLFGTFAKTICCVVVANQHVARITFYGGRPAILTDTLTRAAGGASVMLAEAMFAHKVGTTEVALASVVGLAQHNIAAHTNISREMITPPRGTFDPQIVGQCGNRCAHFNARIPRVGCAQRPAFMRK